VIPTAPPSTDPAQILRYRDRQYAAELIATALLHYDLFTWLNDNLGTTTQGLCEHFGIAARPADVLLTLCRANNFITTDAADRHELTQLAKEHLVKGSPWYLGPYYEPIRNTPITEAYRKVLSTGKPANWQAREDGGDWHESMMSEDFARGFTDLMNCRGLSFGQILAENIAPLLGSHTRLLDIGGGSGIYSSTLVGAHGQLSGIVLEQAPVDAICREEIAKRGLSDRIEVISGDMFQDPWPDDTEILLLSNLLHDWDFPEVKLLLQKGADTLPKDGLLIIHEAFLNNDKTGPLPVAEYSALLMNITQGKCYTPREYGDLLEPLGFRVGRYEDTTADRGFMTALKM
jgi:hypothetical protein